MARGDRALSFVACTNQQDRLILLSKFVQVASLFRHGVLRSLYLNRRVLLATLDPPFQSFFITTTLMKVGIELVGEADASLTFENDSGRGPYPGHNCAEATILSRMNCSTGILQKLFDCPQLLGVVPGLAIKNHKETTAWKLKPCSFWIRVVRFFNSVLIQAKQSICNEVRVLKAATKESDRVKTRREWLHSIQADSAPCRFQGNDPDIGCRHSQFTFAVTIQGNRDLHTCYGDS